MSFINQWMLLASIMCVAVMSPGPDFVMAVRNSVLHGRRAGLFTALGFAVGVIIHVSYCILGLSALIAQSVLAFTILKFAGAAYLIWVGIKALKSKGLQDVTVGASEGRPQKRRRSAFMDGFITNLLNPKAILFFFALFTQIIEPGQPLSHMVVFGATSVTITGLWFAVVAVFLTQNRIRAAFLKFSAIIDKLCGGLFILLGLRLALQKMHE